jgi:hypothetical protein
MRESFQRRSLFVLRIAFLPNGCVSTIDRYLKVIYRHSFHNFNGDRVIFNIVLNFRTFHDTSTVYFVRVNVPDILDRKSKAEERLPPLGQVILTTFDGIGTDITALSKALRTCQVNSRKINRKIAAVND